MRAFLVTLVLLGVVGVVVDASVTQAAERQASEQVSRELAAPAEVELAGWPVSLRLLTGVVPEVRVRASGVPLTATGARLAELEAQLQDVRVDVSRFTTLGRGAVDAAGGRFSASLDTASVAALLASTGAPVSDLSLEQGVVRLQVAGTAVEAQVSAEPNALVLHTAPLGDVRLPIPPLPGGARLAAVEVQPGALHLRGTFPATGPATG